MIKAESKIAIVDYEVGNLHSALKGFRHFTSNAFITNDARNLLSADALVLPGVGSFAAGMEGLKKYNLIEAVKSFAEAEKPILGICLGAQLLMSGGVEFGEYEGLNLIKGKVIKFPEAQMTAKIPHIGWTPIKPSENEKWADTIFENVEENSYMYFIHSYVIVPERSKNILAITNYGGYQFSSALKQENIYGCQFHPEKSGKAGLQIIKNFVDSFN